MVCGVVRDGVGHDAEEFVIRWHIDFDRFGDVDGYAAGGGIGDAMSLGRECYCVSAVGGIDVGGRSLTLVVGDDLCCSVAEVPDGAVGISR